MLDQTINNGDNSPNEFETLLNLCEITERIPNNDEVFFELKIASHTLYSLANFTRHVKYKMKICHQMENSFLISWLILGKFLLAL